MSNCIPQALADEKTKQILCVFETESHLAPFKDKVKTIDAPGVQIYPAEIKVGDLIGFYRTGWDKALVKEIKFNPCSYSQNYHIVGWFIFTCADGFKSIHVDGRTCMSLPLYKFEK